MLFSRQWIKVVRLRTFLKFVHLFIKEVTGHQIVEILFITRFRPTVTRRRRY